MRLCGKLREKAIKKRRNSKTFKRKKEAEYPVKLECILKDLKYANLEDFKIRANLEWWIFGIGLQVKEE